VLADLAGVESAVGALSIRDVARVAAEQVTGISVAFLVCGSGASPTELRAASTAFPAGVEVVAVVCDPDSVPGLRRVAGLSVLTIGYLEDLQKSLARAAAA
jgi:fructoselysine-6-P-deglycase FrlB-like protein